MSIQLASYVTKSGATVSNVTLVLVSLFYNPGAAATPSKNPAPRIAARRAKATGAIKGAIPIRGHLAVYPTASLPPKGQGLPSTPPLETIPFVIAHAGKLPQGTSLPAQVYASLMTQAAYNSATKG